MFCGLDVATLRIIKENKPALEECFKIISSDICAKNIAPKEQLVFNAFRICPADKVRVVLVGQDPYQSDIANGLSFSVRDGAALPPSLKTIYDAIGIDRSATGDLTSWGKQGVLLINRALTTKIGTSNAHTQPWQNFTDGLIRSLCASSKKPLIFILLGTSAQTLMEIIGEPHHVLCWGHPSPLNRYNKTDNPKNFKYCTVFAETNKLLEKIGEALIYWKSVEQGNESRNFPDEGSSSQIAPSEASPDDSVMPGRKLWLFADGGATGNGKSYARASFAFLVQEGDATAHKDLDKGSGMVEKTNAEQPSNNRGELTALMRGIESLMGFSRSGEPTTCYIVSDSSYSINCIEKWYKNWVKYGKLDGKKNLDLIKACTEAVDHLKMSASVKFIHVNSHTDRSACADDYARFLFDGNDSVDKECARLLSKKGSSGKNQTHDE